MKPSLPIALICLLAVPALAQRGGGGGGGMPSGGGHGMTGGGHGGGRPGGGFGGGFGQGGSQGGGVFGAGLKIRPFNPFPGGRFAAGFARGTYIDTVRNQALFGNFGFGYSGGGLGFGGSGLGLGFQYPLSYPAFDTPPMSMPNVTVVYPPPPPPQAVVVYNDPPRPVIHDYDWSGPDAGSSASGSPIYLIALRNGSIYAASSYKVEAGSLQFVTVDGEKKQTPVDSVDRALSSRLNRERRVSFQLPE